MTTLVSGQVSVTNGTAVQIVPARTTRTKLLIYAPGGILIGPSTLTQSNGYPPFGIAGQGGIFDSGQLASLSAIQDSVWALALGPTTTVYFLEDF